MTKKVLFLTVLMLVAVVGVMATRLAAQRSSLDEAMRMAAQENRLRHHLISCLQAELKVYDVDEVSTIPVKEA